MRLTIDGSKMILDAMATPVLIELLRRLEGRRHWIERSTRLSLEATEHNISVLKELPSLQINHVPQPVPKAKPPRSKEYKQKTTPYDHQVTALTKMRTQRTFGLFMEQGTGKTKVVLDRAGELHAEGKVTGLIVVSRKGVHRQWIESEAPAHLGCEWYGAFWPLKETPPELLEVGGPLKVLTINYDALARVAFAKKMVMQFVQAHRGTLMIAADESQEIKNNKTQRSKSMAVIGQWASYRALTTGTPIAKDLTDEWAQLKWLNEAIIGIKYVTTFRANYCVMGGFEGRVVVAHKNVEAFQARVEPYVYRVTKDDIGIEAKQYNKWVYDLVPAQVRMLRTLKKELEAELDSGRIVTAANAVGALNKLQQVASGFIIEGMVKDGDLHRVKRTRTGVTHRLMPIDKNPRIKAALEWLEADDTGGKAVIWHRFREEAPMLAEAMTKAGITFAIYDGSDKVRAEAKASFLDKEGARVFLANPQAAGTGHNLQGLCTRALYYSNSFNALDRWQSEDRIHRIGTKGIVTYTDMIAKGSIDTYILRNLQRKKGLSQWVLGDIRSMLDEVM